MRMHRSIWCLAALGFAVFVGQGGIFGSPTPDQRKELANIQKEVSKAGGLVTKKEYQEAEKKIGRAHV